MLTASQNTSLRFCIPGGSLNCRSPLQYKLAYGAGFCIQRRPTISKTHQRLARRYYAAAVGEQTTTLPEILELLLRRQNLTEQQSEDAMKALLAGDNQVQTAAFLIALRAKGETAEEVAGLARAMLAEGLAVPTDADVLDIVGTGGDGIGSVNISTGATIIAAAAGAKVAKHGNRSVSSLCGSADVLEALGVEVDLGPAGVRRCLEQVGVGFMFAPRYHPAMKAVVPVRKALKVRTTFNMLGPLLNPARAAYGLVGVYSTDIAPLMAATLQRLGTKKALVVHSMGLDELTPMGPADVLEVSASGTRKYRSVVRTPNKPQAGPLDLLRVHLPLSLPPTLTPREVLTGAANRSAIWEGSAIWFNLLWLCWVALPLFKAFLLCALLG
eukprot:jgi/Botrbrau1/8802/Bobra.0330s0033.2